MTRIGQLGSRLTGVAAVVALCCPGPVLSQAWPSRTVTIVSPFAAGSGVDILGRHLANEFQDKLGHPFVVENKVGANGNVGAAAAAKAAPDGNTLLIVTPGIAVQNKYVYKSMPFDFERDFSPIVLVAKAPMMVMVNPKVAAKTLPDLIAYARANPGKINVSSTGTGSQGHVTLDLMKRMAGFDMAHVPYNNTASMNTDIVSGQVEATINYVTTMAGLVKAGDVRALAITSKQRAQDFPDVPTLEEAGFPGLESVGWYGLYSPRGAPPEVAAKIAPLVNAWIASDRGKQALRDLGMQATGGGADALNAWIKVEDARWGAILKAVVVPQ